LSTGPGIGASAASSRQPSHAAQSVAPPPEWGRGRQAHVPLQQRAEASGHRRCRRPRRLARIVAPHAGWT